MTHCASPAAAVLVVEDEPLIRMVAVDMIEDAGIPAYEAANASEAIACLKEREDIRVLFTDVNMPGVMDGVALAHYVHQRFPEVKIIVTTGRRMIGADDLPHDSATLPKPYHLSQLIQMLRERVPDRVNRVG